MSDIEFNCLQCEKPIVADETHVGEVTTCPSCRNSMVIPYPQVKPGMEIGEFIVLKKIGSGGMGEVWLANQPSLERRIALKILTPSLVENSDFIQRFNQEVRMAGRLNHPNLVTAYAAGSDKGLYYLASYYVDGVELKNRITMKHNFSEKEALRIALDIAEALNYAWKKFGIIHRDIKPSNIMIDKDGTPMLMDMGISKSVSESSDLTMTGFTVGTPHYMSPEQSRGQKEIDCRADIYSLGATLFHMMTGSVPYKGDGLVEVLASLLSNPLPSARRLNPRISEPAEALLELMLAKDKSERPQDWDALIRNIKRVMKRRTPDLPRPKSIGADQEAIRRAQKSSEKKVLTILLSVLMAGLFLLLLVKKGVIFNNNDKPDTGGTEKVVGLDDADLSKDTSSDTEKTVDVISSEDDTKGEDDKGSENTTEKAISDDQAVEFWNAAETFGKGVLAENGDFEAAITSFETVKQRLFGTVYELKAEQEISRLKNAKQQYLDKIIADLTAESDKFVEGNDYESAIEVFDEYKGRYVDELKKEINSALSSLRNEKLQYLAELKRQEEEAERKRQEEEARLAEEKAKKEGKISDFFKHLADSLLNSPSKFVFRTAYSDFELFEFKDEFPKTRETLDLLASTSKVVTNYFKRLVGKKVSLTVDSKKVSGTLLKVEENQIHLLVKKGEQVSFTQVYPFKSLPSSIKAKAYSECESPTKEVYTCVMLGRQKKYDRALSIIELVGREGSEMNWLEKAMKGVFSNALAKDEYEKILKILDLSSSIIGTDEEFSIILEVEVNDRLKLFLIEDALNRFEEEYAESGFYKDRTAIFKALRIKLGIEEEEPEDKKLDSKESAKDDSSKTEVKSKEKSSSSGSSKTASKSKKLAWEEKIKEDVAAIVKEAGLTSTDAKKAQTVLQDAMTEMRKLMVTGKWLTFDSMQNQFNSIIKEARVKLEESLPSLKTKELAISLRDYVRKLRKQFDAVKNRKKKGGLRRFDNRDSE